MHHGYEPSRITDLTQRSRWAVDALDGIHSTDPAAAEAMAAVAGLKAVIANRILPAATMVGIVDPLGAPGDDSRLVDRFDGPGAWWDRHATRPNRFADWTDDELFEVMFDHDAWFDDLKIWDQPNHPFWSEELPDLVEQFRLRAIQDPEFAQRMIDEAAGNPMIGLIVAQGGFGDEVLTNVTIAVATNGSEAYDSGASRSFILDELLTEFEYRTDAAIIVFTDPETFEILFTWNEHEHTTRPIDQTRLETLLGDVLDAPFDDAEALEDVQHVIANVVDLADNEFFDDGFPPSLALTIADGIIPYLPFIIGTLNEEEGVKMRDFDGDRAETIGTNAEVADLFGNLLRDPVTREYLLDTIVALTITADPDSDFYNLDDVKKYIRLLLDAAENEEIEEQVEASQERDGWNLTIDIVFGLVEKGLEAGGKRTAAALAALGWIEKGTRWLVDQIGADEIGLDDFEATVRIMFSIGLATAFLGTFTPENEDDEEDFAEAQVTLADIEAILADAEVNGSQIDLDELSGKVRDLEDDIEQIDDAVFAPIGDVGLNSDEES